MEHGSCRSDDRVNKVKYAASRRTGLRHTFSLPSLNLMRKEIEGGGKALLILRDRFLLSNVPGDQTNKEMGKTEQYTHMGSKQSKT